MPRFVLHPDYVTSKEDGQSHFVGGPRLARLYGVDIRQCVYGDVSSYREQVGDMHLHPRSDGNYSLPAIHHCDLQEAIGLVRQRWGRLTPYRLGRMVGECDMQVKNPYPNERGAKLFDEGVMQGTAERLNNATRHVL